MSDETLYAAWVAANTEITNPGKDGKGNYGKYLTLDALLDAVRPIYSRHGLVWWQTIQTRDGQMGVTTHLAHKSGERISFGTMYGPIGQNVQQMGSVRTYLSRYSYLTAMGIAGGEDDDAASISTTPRRKPEPVASGETVAIKRSAPSDGPTDNQMKAMGAALREAGLSAREDVLAYVSKAVGREVTSRNELTPKEADTVIAALRKQEASA